MASVNNIYRKCDSCGGDGVEEAPSVGDPSATRSCVACDGTGEILWGVLKKEDK